MTKPETMLGSALRFVIRNGATRLVIPEAIVLEDLDFLVDCANGRLVPRDPKHIISEVE